MAPRVTHGASTDTALEPRTSNYLDEQTKTQITETVVANVVSENALVAVTGPLGVSDGTDVGGGYSSDQVSVYVVRPGDSISQIANMFDITPDTILSANDMNKGDTIKAGDILLILPFSGVEHTVAKGETLQGIAKAYNIEVSKIIANNIDLTVDSKLAIGEKLMIPGADMLGSKNVASSRPSTGSSLQNIPGYFINPLPTGPRIRKTQGVHDKYAIDIGAPTGTPIYASASGTVIFAKVGWNGGYGNAVFIKHPNGTETRYAHMSALNTSPGKQVVKGEIIGYVGSTGRSTGPHLHFEVRGAKNPGVDGSWASR
ncbi:LysM peptidoglycan-binding domain-containing M23 family metallopeptidase [Candidatus Nomurabacteria bacterium]|nr:LysM peptidoglycan-binding domain-containing M23 family metallopeptidase [Candidatus Nomurabacteria bacterium]